MADSDELWSDDSMDIDEEEEEEEAPRRMIYGRNSRNNSRTAIMARVDAEARHRFGDRPTNNPLRRLQGGITKKPTKKRRVPCSLPASMLNTDLTTLDGLGGAISLEDLDRYSQPIATLTLLQIAERDREVKNLRNDLEEEKEIAAHAQGQAHIVSNEYNELKRRFESLNLEHETLQYDHDFLVAVNEERAKLEAQMEAYKEQKEAEARCVMM
ncbi:hypothetical protein K402DRAFT_418916 [Aulographum hederae CBS 113979]|uniref:Uncharacterized protein n=1 Tax=Aulographum hederae CBS 113979 TaxID=1176131 RepID=A0A6G1H7Q7_9PEZI|nr:hypothetical protein K402DRAFT_418916 [Aulographum hederae CBS 113979]